MKASIKKMENNFAKEIESVSSVKELQDLKVSYFGKKGKIPAVAEKMKDVPKEEKKDVGMLLNNFKELFNKSFLDAEERLKELELREKLNNEWIDITLPSTKVTVGTSHPLTKVITEIENLFISMGYDVVEGPEIESDLYNFEKLNIAKDHPARDMQDSFYINAEMLLRTQTSPVQARTMDNNKNKTPIRIICPGKVYRKDDDDMTHSHQFTQIEGLVIDEGISVAHLKGTLEVFAKKMFGDSRDVRLRPSFFPFTEPSLEVDVSCFNCDKKGCNICKHTGWIEILGAGMVHPNVLESCGYDSKKYSGFAFGMGPERIAMLKYGIKDIREFYTNDLRFLENFNRLEREVNSESK